MLSGTTLKGSGMKGSDCSICLSALTTGKPLLTLSCAHKFHLHCLMTCVKAQHDECPLCRTVLEDSLKQLLSEGKRGGQQQASNYVIPSAEDLLVEPTRHLSATRVASSNDPSVPLLAASTTLEFDGQLTSQESDMYGLVTVQASASDPESLPTRVPVDLVCVVDQSRSMAGQKMTLLKQTLVYITEQLNESDRLAIVSFDKQAFDRSHGLKRMTDENQQTLQASITNDIQHGSGTNIGAGLEKGIQILTDRQSRNPVSALLLLTDGQDTYPRYNYSQLMQNFPIDVICHTFGYGSDHMPSLLVELVEQGNGGTFSYVDQGRAVGPAFVAVLAGLLSRVAQQVRVNVELNGDYQVTKVHSKYKYDPDQLPSSKITFLLSDLNAGEKRHLVFQIHIPRIDDTPTDVNPRQGESGTLSDHVIGRVRMDYTDVNRGQTVSTTLVPFHLIRASELMSDSLRVNSQVDVQRNRIQTTQALREAMDERSYTKSLEILRDQMLKIKASVTAQDPFCQQLVKDLEFRHASEQEYRSTHLSSYTQQRMERGAYTPAPWSATSFFLTPHQLHSLDGYERQNT